LLKLGIRVSPRTVRRYIPSGVSPRRGVQSQTWRTFVRNHASAVIACDFFVTITATFRVLYVFVVLDVGTRQIRHVNGTIRRECLDWMIPLNEEHLRRILREWVVHYNRGRPHASLGPGIPDRPSNDVLPLGGHRIRDGCRVLANPVLGGLHHEYRLGSLAA
jgi:hypothetical protein